MRLLGYKPLWIIENVWPLDGRGPADAWYEGDAPRPSCAAESWDTVFEDGIKREENGEPRYMGIVLDQWVEEHQTVPRPPIVVRNDTPRMPGPALADGHHRVIAALDAGLRYIPLDFMEEWDATELVKSWSNQNGHFSQEVAA